MDANRQSSTYSVLRQHGVDRRAFLKFCTAMAASMGLEVHHGAAGRGGHGNQTPHPGHLAARPGMHLLQRSFIRGSHPIAQDVVLNMISLDYDDTLQAAAGEQAEEIRKKIMKDYKGQLHPGGGRERPHQGWRRLLHIGGRELPDILKETAEDAKAIVAWGSCASNGCVQNAHPNPTGAKPVKRIISHKPIINVPGCPPIAEVMTGVLTYILTFDQLPELDRYGRPKMFYGQRIHDKCYRRAFFDAGQFVESWDDDGARKGWCLYKMGCRGPIHLQFLLHGEMEQRRFLPHRLAATPASAARKRISGITGRSTSACPQFPCRASNPRPTRRQDPGGLDRHRRGAHLASYWCAAPAEKNARSPAPRTSEPRRRMEVSHVEESRRRSRHPHRRPPARGSHAR